VQDPAEPGEIIEGTCEARSLVFCSMYLVA
jgi:hypothetical protein